jgi:hypothetical protein
LRLSSSNCLLRSTGSKASARVVLEGLAGKAALPTLTQLLKLVQSFIEKDLLFLEHVEVLVEICLKL